LVLHDEPLTIRQIRGIDLRNPQFAFLSACDTYRGGTSIPDESITLASAFQLAGYQHVIAALWQISGWTAPDIASLAYDQIIKNDNEVTTIDVDATAVVLHQAILALRKKSPDMPPMLWAPYIHTGP